MIVRDSSVCVAGLKRGQNVVASRAKGLDGSGGEVFVGIQEGHAGTLFLFVVLPNSRFDFISEDALIGPRALKIWLS